MGKINRRSKITALLFVLLLSLVLSVSGCGDTKIEENQETVKNEQTQQEDEKVKEEKEDIPSELLPGQDTDEQNTEDMEIVDEDGEVYETESVTDNSQSAKSNNKKNNSSSQNTNAQDNVIRISFSIDSSNVDSPVSFAADMTLDEGSTVYDALAASGVPFSGKSYISEIGGLGEKMHGSQSGWKYYVNGSAPGKSCNKYVLKNGDKLQWKYVLTI